MEPTTYRAIAAAVLVAVSAASALLYARQHRAQHYATDRRACEDSPQLYAVVYRVLRLVIVLAGLGALASDHRAFLRWHDAPGLQLLGSALALGGFALFAAARRTLGRHYSPCFDAHLPGDVVTTGPYARIRHPIYTANLTILTGLCLSTGSAWLIVCWLVLLRSYAVSAAREERALAGAHPEYRAYVRRSGRFMPRLGAA